MLESFLCDGPYTQPFYDIELKTMTLIKKKEQNTHTHILTGCAGSSRLGGLALRPGASAAELPELPSNPEAVGCEPHGTLAVCLPARTGPVFV